MGPHDLSDEALKRMHFICEICGEERCVGMRIGRWVYARPQDVSLPPVCKICEDTWGRPVGAAGTMRDRRIARQIDALAERLATLSYSNANPIKWSADHAAT